MNEPGDTLRAFVPFNYRHITWNGKTYTPDKNPIGSMFNAVIFTLNMVVPVTKNSLASEEGQNELS